VEAKKAELALVTEKLTKYKDQKAKAKIYAPSDGLVVYSREGHWWRSDDAIEEGAEVRERQSLIELPDTSKMKAVIRVHETQIENLAVNAPAVVEIEGFSGQRFTGKVSKIAVLADSQNMRLNPNLKEYETEVLLDGEFSDMKPGATARVEIYMAQLDDVLAAPVQSVFGRNGRYFVFVDNGGDVEPVEVEVGLSSNEYVEIKSGLTAGQQIRLAVTKDEQLLLPGSERNGGNGEPGPGDREPTMAGAQS
jgi:RND family efflux transporter MFP subunit